MLSLKPEKLLQQLKQKDRKSAQVGNVQKLPSITATGVKYYMSYSLQIYSLIFYKHSLERKEVDLQAIRQRLAVEIFFKLVL